MTHPDRAGSPFDGPFPPGPFNSEPERTPDEALGAEPIDNTEALALAAALAAPGSERAALAAEVGPDAAEAFLADPQHLAEIAALRGFLGGLREELQAGLPSGAAARDGGTAPVERDAAAARRIARRVLARTTRLDRGWRGDLRLVLDFTADRLRDSALLRAAAALLLVQVTVVPLVAWHLWRAPEPHGFQVRIERRAPAAPADAAEAHEPIEVLDDASLPALASEEHAPALRALGAAVRAAHAAAGAGRPEVGAERLLRERAEALAGTLPEGYVPAAPTTPLERLLALDLALDRRLLVGHARELGALLDATAAELAVAAPGSYAAAVRRRAAALHLVPSQAEPAAPVGVDARGAEAALTLAADVPALRAALAAEGAAEGPWARAWLQALADRSDQADRTGR